MESIYQGYTSEKKYCIRCGQPNPDILYKLCPECREYDELLKTFDRLDDFAEAQDLLKAARAIRAYWDMSLSDKKQVEQYCMLSDGYESGMQTRASLGV